MKIERNGLCPCGSGKKYKYCCLWKETASTEQLIRFAVDTSGYDDRIADALCNLYGYMQKKQWWGACHASSAVLYVAFSELGYNPKLCIGEVLGQNLYFDHSWIELDGEIIDLAISMTLLDGASVSDPVLFGKNIRTGMKPDLQYGFSGRGIENEALIAAKLPFIEYMDAFPDEEYGLWSIVEEVLEKQVNINTLKNKYKNTKRLIV